MGSIEIGHNSAYIKRLGEIVIGEILAGDDIFTNLYKLSRNIDQRIINIKSWLKKICKISVYFYVLVKFSLIFSIELIWINLKSALNLIAEFRFRLWLIMISSNKDEIIISLWIIFEKFGSTFGLSMYTFLIHSLNFEPNYVLTEIEWQFVWMKIRKFSITKKPKTKINKKRNCLVKILIEKHFDLKTKKKTINRCLNERKLSVPSNQCTLVYAKKTVSSRSWIFWTGKYLWLIFYEWKNYKFSVILDWFFLYK